MRVRAGTEAVTCAGTHEFADTVDAPGVAGTAEKAAPATTGPSPLAFIDACSEPGALRVRDFDDEVYGRIHLPWLAFFGVPTELVWVSTNGVLGFVNESLAYSNACFGGEIRNAVFPFWDDLVASSDGVCLVEIGSAPNRRFVATWKNTGILEAPGMTRLNFSVVLNESDYTIDVLYGAMTGGGRLSAGQSATIGLADRSRYYLDCCEEACVQNFSGRRYTPVAR